MPATLRDAVWLVMLICKTAPLGLDHGSVPDWYQIRIPVRKAAGVSIHLTPAEDFSPGIAQI